jgi:hypothetical protein
MKIILLILLANVFAETKVSTDLVSRYIWRGLASGDSPAIQPSIEYSNLGLNIGAWASYSISSAEKSNVENNFYLSTSINGLDITFTDYYFPSVGELFTMETHTFELTLNYSYLVDMTLSNNIYNDYSTYIQISKEIDGLTLFVGGVPSKSKWYGTNKPAIIELGAKASKGDFSVSYVLNPNDKKNYINFIYSL